MTISLNEKGLKTLQSFRHWQTNNELETIIEFEPVLLENNNFLHINSVHKAADGRKRSDFIHDLTLGEVVTIRDFLNEVIAMAAESGNMCTIKQT
jgi:hypothetical protein